MNFSDDFIQKIQERLALPLPGEPAQFQMAPAGRTRANQLPASYNPRKSAVLILLFQNGNDYETALIQRPVYEGIHSGQIAFPGGRMEEYDPDEEAAALREAEEEIGVARGKIKVLGRLSDLYINPSNYLVTPVIGYHEGIPAFYPDGREVERVFTASLRRLASESAKSIKIIEHSNGYKLKTPYYDIEGFTVWGATAMMISELNAIVAEIIS